MTEPTAQLLGATRRRLFVTTLALVATLIVVIGAATAFVGLRALDLDVDRALASTVDAAVTRLDGELPSGEASGESDDASPAVADTLLLYLDATGPRSPTRRESTSRACPTQLPSRRPARTAVTFGRWTSVGSRSGC